MAGFGFEFQAPNWVINQHKQTANFTRISDSDCREMLGDRSPLLSEQNIQYCAIDPSRVASICHGDIGSSMTMVIDGELTLVGIVSLFTNMCSPNYPVLYTKVYRFSTWLNGLIS